jgi:hypothetical protein
MFYGRAARGSLIDPSRGNLIEQYATPAGGPLDPVVVLNLCTTLPRAGTWDRVSPIIGEDPSGGCIWSIRGQWDHIWKDMLPW